MGSSPGPGFQQGLVSSGPWPGTPAPVRGYSTGLSGPWQAPLACLPGCGTSGRASAPSLHRAATGRPVPGPVGCVILGSHVLSLALFFRRRQQAAVAEWECVPLLFPAPSLRKSAHVGVRPQQDTDGLRRPRGLLLGAPTWPVSTGVDAQLDSLSVCSLLFWSGSLLFTSPELGGQRDLGGAAGLSGSLTNDLPPQPLACLSQTESRRPPRPNIPGDATSAEK